MSCFTIYRKATILGLILYPTLCMWLHRIYYFLQHLPSGGASNFKKKKPIRNHIHFHNQKLFPITFLILKDDWGVLQRALWGCYESSQRTVLQKVSKNPNSFSSSEILRTALLPSPTPWRQVVPSSEDAFRNHGHRKILLTCCKLFCTVFDRKHDKNTVQRI